MLKPDLVLVFDSHWFTTVEFVVTAADASHGLLHQRGAAPRDVERALRHARATPTSLDLVGKIADETDDCWITPIDNEHLPITYATLNFLSFLQGDEAWASIERLPDGREPRLRDGRSRSSPRRSPRATCASSLIASGALEPHLPHTARRCARTKPRGEEHIYSARGAPLRTTRVIDALVRGDHAQVVNEMDEFMTVRPEGHFAHYQMMVARASAARLRRAPGRLYSAYENSIGTGQVHVVVRPTRQRMDDELMSFAGSAVPAHRDRRGVDRCRRLPWHYSGDLLTVEYRTDPAERSARVLARPDVELAHDDEDPGAVAFIWADWQSCGDDGAELLDPVRSQYKEAFVVVRCRYKRSSLQSLPVHLGRQGLRARARISARGTLRNSALSTTRDRLPSGSSRPAPRTGRHFWHDPRGQ